MRMARQGLGMGAVLGMLLLLGHLPLQAEEAVPKKAEEDMATKAEATALCAKCGEVAGAENCCKPGEACAGCGMHKGSPGCCALPKGAEGKVALCGCGQVKGTEKCCQKDAKKCEGCGMAAKSPGCKIKCSAP